MSFDIDNALGEMADAMKLSVAGDLGDIRSFALEALNKQRASLEELAQARLDGDLDDEELQEELAREMLVVETELLAVTVMGKAMVQKAINAAIGVLMKIVTTAL